MPQPNSIDLVLIREIERSGMTDLQVARATGDRLTKETIGNVRGCNNHATSATIAILAELFHLELRRKPKPRVKR